MSERGPVCDPCQLRLDSQGQFLKTLKNSGYGALTLSLVSLVFNPLAATTFMSISAAVWTMRAYATHVPEWARVASVHRGPLWAARCSFVFAALAVLRILIAFGAIRL